MRLFSLEERDGGLSLIQEPDKNTSLEIVDPLIGTEGMGTEYGGMMPMTGVPFGSMHLVPVTRTNRVSATSFNALDRQLLGFILTRQPAIWSSVGTDPAKCLSIVEYAIMSRHAGWGG